VKTSLAFELLYYPDTWGVGQNRRQFLQRQAELVFREGNNSESAKTEEPSKGRKKGGIADVCPGVGPNAREKPRKRRVGRTFGNEKQFGGGCFLTFAYKKKKNGKRGSDLKQNARRKNNRVFPGMKKVGEGKSMGPGPFTYLKH